MKALLICLLIAPNIQIQNINEEFSLNIPYYKSMTNEEIINSLNLNIEYERFSFNIQPTFQEIGTKRYVLYATDKFNKVDLYHIKINVYDDIPPTIYGPDKINIKSNKIINIYDTLKYYFVYDEIDQNIGLFIEETNYVEPYNKDEYYLKLYCLDSSKNYTYKKVIMTKNTTIMSIFYRNDLNLTLLQNTIYYPKDIINLLINSYQLENLKYDNYYFENHTQYIFYNKTQKENINLKVIKNDLIENLKISVNIIENKIKEKSFIEKIINALKVILKRILSL